RSLRSFPTRRSSDLSEAGKRICFGCAKGGFAHETCIALPFGAADFVGCHVSGGGIPRVSEAGGCRPETGQGKGSGRQQRKSKTVFAGDSPRAPDLLAGAEALV